jgi:uncharacterized protein (DUF58 family)
LTGFSPLQHEADALGAGLPPLMVAADRLAASISLGAHGRRKAGIGENFWQFRRYGSADSVGRIDWRQSAKSQHLFVREREWEAAQSLWFWRDSSKGMRYGSGTTTKLERANLLALALGALLVRGGERIALLGAHDRPSASRAALARMAHRLLDRPPTDDELPPDAPVAEGGELVWISDFLVEPARFEAAVTQLSRLGVRGHLLRIVDPAEADFPFLGRTRFESADKTKSEIFGRAESVAPAYRARFKAHGEEIARLAARRGWTCLVHRTDRPPQTALIALHAGLSGAISAQTVTMMARARG